MDCKSAIIMIGKSLSNGVASSQRKVLLLLVWKIIIISCVFLLNASAERQEPQPGGYPQVYNTRERDFRSSLVNPVLKFEEFRVIPIDDWTARVLGKIKVSCEYREWTLWKMKEVYWDTRLGPREKFWWERDDSSERSQMLEFVPEKITLKNPVGPDAKCDVLDSGDFSAIIKSTARTTLKGEIENSVKYFFQSPKSCPKYYAVFNYVKDVIEVEIHTEPTEKYNVSASCKKPLKVWFYGIDEDVLAQDVRRAVGSQETKVIIKFYEKNSRIPVFPKVTITGIKVPKRDILVAKWKEFCKDSYIGEKGVKYIPNSYLQEGQTVEEETDIISFTGLSDAMYKIETRHPKFYYFSDVLTADMLEQTKRAILLIEIGDKVRQDDEGQGAIMVEE